MKKQLKFYIFGSLLFLLFLELLLQFYFYLRHNSFLLFTDSKKNNIQQTFNPSGSTLHPYLGYVLRKGRTGEYFSKKWVVNNSGFHNLTINNTDYYPYYPKQDEIIVGIFGGSVAAGLALFSQGNNLLKEKIKDSFPIYENKKIKILNFSLPGFKQPQQLLTLIYFLQNNQHFDIIINLDGFNEAVTGFKNFEDTLDLSMPANQLWSKFGNSNLRVDQDMKVHLKRFLELKNHHIQKSLKKHNIAILYYINKLKILYNSQRIKTLNSYINLPEKKILFPKSFLQEKVNSDNLYEKISSLWFYGSKLMNDICNLNNIKYFHFLQPNQWLAINSEIFIPFDANHQYKWVKKPVDEGYKKFVSNEFFFKENNIIFKDLTFIFDGKINQQIYSDDCCHLTQKGNEILIKNFF